MSTHSYIILSTMVLSALIIVAICFRSRHFFKNFTLCALSGIGTLFAVNLFTVYTGVSIAVNYITLLTGMFLGIPGIIATVLSQILI